MRANLLLTALVLCLVSLAWALPSTSHFEDLTTEVTARQNALPLEGLTKDEKKQRSALKKYGKTVAKDHAALINDVKSAAKIDKALSKVYADVEIDGLLDDLLTNLGADLSARFGALDTRVNDLPAAKPAVKATKARDKAQAFLGSAQGALDRKTAYKNYKKALLKIRSGEKQVTKAENGGGGGKCTGRSPTGGEFGSLFNEGASGRSQEHLKVTVARDGNRTITQFQVDITDCKGVGYSVLIEGEPVVGTYRFGGGSRGYAIRLTGGAFNEVLTQSVVEITFYNATTGIVVGNATKLDNDSDPSVMLRFRSESGF